MLTKSLLSSLPIYQCSLLLAPTGVLQDLQKQIWKLFRKGGKHNENKLHLISWDKVTKPLHEGGIQIKDLKSHNLAMGGKII